MKIDILVKKSIISLFQRISSSSENPDLSENYQSLAPPPGRAGSPRRMANWEVTGYISQNDWPLSTQRSPDEKSTPSGTIHPSRLLRAVGAQRDGSGKKTWSQPKAAIRCREWSFGNLAANGDSPRQGIRRRSKHMVPIAGGLRLSPSDEKGRPNQGRAAIDSGVGKQARNMHPSLDTQTSFWRC